MNKSSTLANQQNTREIPFDGWIPFLAEFTLENRGAHARMEIVCADDELGYEIPVENRPFDGVAADTKDNERNVWIAFGSTAEDHMTHGIERATALRALAAGETTGAVLEIEAADGSRTILELTNPVTYALPSAETSKSPE